MVSTQQTLYLRDNAHAGAFSFCHRPLVGNRSRLLTIDRPCFSLRACRAPQSHFELIIILTMLIHAHRLFQLPSYRRCGCKYYISIHCICEVLQFRSFHTVQAPQATQHRSPNCVILTRQVPMSTTSDRLVCGPSRTLPWLRSHYPLVVRGSLHLICTPAGNSSRQAPSPST